MTCPWCSGWARVVDSRETKTGVRRRRECTACERRFSTREVLFDDEQCRTVFDLELAATIEDGRIVLRSSPRPTPRGGS